MSWQVLYGAAGALSLSHMLDYRFNELCHSPAPVAVALIILGFLGWPLYWLYLLYYWIFQTPHYRFRRRR